jgi:hypothetical protein
MKHYYCLIPTVLILSISFADLASSQYQSGVDYYGVVYSSDKDIKAAL